MWFDYFGDHKQLLYDVLNEWKKTIEKAKENKDGRLFLASIVDLKDNKIVHTSMNSILKNKSPIFHAEVTCIHETCKKLNTLMLKNYHILISSHEPCVMCAGAAFWAGINHVVYFYDYSDTMNIFNVNADIKLVKSVTGGSIRLKSSELLTFEKIESKHFRKIVDSMFLNNVNVFNDLEVAVV